MGLEGLKFNKLLTLPGPLIFSNVSVYSFSVAEDEGLGEVDSFVGQTPPSSHSTTPQVPLSTSGLFHGPGASTADPFAQVSQGPPSGPPNSMIPTRAPPSGPVAGSTSQTSSVPPTGPPLAAVPPMPTASGMFHSDL